MSDVVGGTNIRVGVTSGVASGLSEARKQFKLFAGDVNATLIQSYRSADSAQRTFRGGLTRLGNELQDVSKKMALVSAGSIFAGAKSFKDFATIERMEKGLELYGETLQDVRRIAKEPGVGVFDGTKALVGLRAVRLESGLAERAVKSFANAIAGAGGESSDLEPALFNLKQFKATQNINTVDLRQLANRIPQTMEVLEKQFGTADPAKLNQLGIDKFIEGFVSGLEKLPKVSGGANMALEQLGDSATFFSATLGKGIDMTYGVTGVLKSLGSVLDDLSTNFAALNPEAQKAILLVGGLAVAVPVLVGAVGTLIKLLPITAAGFAGISWPVVAVLATVSALAGLAAIMPLVTSKTAEYNKQQEVVSGFATKLDPLIAKYEQLKNSTGKEEQAELRDVIKQIAEVVPSAVTGWDRYGNAIGINTDKVKIYTEEQKKLLVSMQAVRREQLLAENKRGEVRVAELQGKLKTGQTTDYLGMGQYLTRKATNPELVDAARQIADLNAKAVANRRELASIGSTGLDADIKKLNQLRADRAKYSKELDEVRARQGKGTYEEDKRAALDLLKIKGQFVKAERDVVEQEKKVEKSNYGILQYNQAIAEAKERAAKADGTGANGAGAKGGPAGQSINDLQDRLKNLREAYNSLDPTADNYKKRQAEIAEEVRKVTLQIDSQGKAFETAAGAVKAAAKEAKEAGKYYKQLTELGYVNWQIDLASKYLKEQKAVKDATDQYKELVGVVKNLNVQRLGLSDTTGSIIGQSAYDSKNLANAKLLNTADSRMSQTLKSIDNQSFRGAIRNSAASEMQEFMGPQTSLSEFRKYFEEIPKIAGESDTQYANRVYSIVDRTKQLSSALSSTLKDAANETAAAFGELLGNLMTGAGGVEQFGKRVIGSLATMMKDMGKSLIAAGTAGIALKVFAKNPYLALAAGIGLVALGQATQNKIGNDAGKAVTRFKNAGMAYKPMQAIVGDNHNAWSDPEFIAPYSRLDTSIKKSVKGALPRAMGGSEIVAEYSIRGEDLHTVLRRVQVRDSAIFGG